MSAAPTTPAPAPATPAPLNPFPGPKPYSSDQAAIFFGREAQVDELTSLVLSTSAVLLHAPSGYGKSSLVEAGLRPSLEELGVAVLPTVRLGRAQAVPSGGTSRPQDNPFVRVVRETVDPAGPPAPLSDVLRGDALRVLVIDQFEELFLDPALWQERGAFLEQLKQALEADRRLRVVLGLRSDYLADLLPYESALPGRLLLRYALGSMDEAAARRVISDACRDTGVPVSDQDLDDLLDHLLALEPAHPSGQRVRGQSVNLVQLQVLCRRLWAERAGSTAGSAAVRGTPDLAASMRLFVDDAVTEVVRELHMDEGVLRRWMEEHLLTANDRRAVLPLDEDAGGLPRAAVECLERARLVQVEQRNRTHWVELSHDSMVSALHASNRRWDERYARRYRRRVALTGALAVAVLAVFPWLPRTDAQPSVRAAGTSEPGGAPLAALSTSARGQAFLLTGMLGPPGVVTSFDGVAGAVGPPALAGEDVPPLPVEGTALRVLEVGAAPAPRTVAEVQTDEDGVPDLFVAAAAVPGARYEVRPGDVAVSYELFLEALPVHDLRYEQSPSRLSTADGDWWRTALLLPPAALVSVHSPALPEVTGGRTLHVSDEAVLVEAGSTGVLLVEVWEPGHPLEVRPVAAPRSLTPGAAQEVEVDEVTVVELTGLTGRLPAVVTTGCDRPVDVEVVGDEDDAPITWPGRGNTTRTVVLGPVPADERLVLTTRDGRAATCTTAVVPVPEVEVPDRTALSVPVTGPVTAVPLAVDEDRILLLPVPEGQSATLRCDDGQVLSAEAGERLLAYLEPGKACTLALDSWAVYPATDEGPVPAPAVGTLLPPAELTGGAP